jgi:peptidoglycan/xylan/chitin deacetylase (PgdA/CDA1 family)
MTGTGAGSWPKDGSLAVSIVVAVEEGAERSPQTGQKAPEPFTEGYAPEGAWRNWFTESMWEYGARSGLARILDVLDEHDVPASLAWCGAAAEANPEGLRAGIEAGHEILCRGRLAVPGPELSPEQEQANVRQGVEILTRLASAIDPGAAPTGWFGRWPTARTAGAVHRAGLEHFSDSHAADHPYEISLDTGKLLALPWTPDLDDERFWCDPRMAGLRTASDFLDVLERAKELLRGEAKHAHRMMTIVVRPRISGHPARVGALDEFLRGNRDASDLRFCRRSELAEAWRRTAEEQTHAS